MTGSRSSRRRDSGWACPWRKGLVVLLLAGALLSGSGTGFDEPERTLAEPEAASLEEITLIAEALAWLGTPYLPGGFSRSGADCSGFISSLLQSAFPDGGPFPRRSEDYGTFGTEAKSIEPGDILLFARDGLIYHVGLALSDSNFIHSASEGARTGVIITGLGEGSWASRLFGIRRLGQ